MDRIVFAAVLLYGPFLWCFARKESFDDYGFNFHFDRSAAGAVSFWLSATLVPLTFVAMWWPTGGIPRDVSLDYFFKMALPGVTAAIIEEIFFRGWLQTLLRKKLDALPAIVASSAVFALTHMIFQTRPLFLATFFPGLVMGHLREKSGSVFPPILYHGLANIWAIWFFPNP